MYSLSVEPMTTVVFNESPLQFAFVWLLLPHPGGATGCKTEHLPKDWVLPHLLRFAGCLPCLGL